MAKSGRKIACPDFTLGRNSQVPAGRQERLTQDEFYMYGGIIFGLGWALAGACPGPMFTLIGAGYVPILVVVLFSILETFLYGVLRIRLPH